MARIVSLGSALQDIYLVDHDDLIAKPVDDSFLLNRIEVGSEVEIDHILYEIGGDGVNAAVSLARHGHEVIYMGNIARDSAGTAIVKTLDREGIDGSYVNFMTKKATGTSVILLNSKNSERTILTCHGASNQFGNFKEQDLDLAQPDWLFVSTLYGDFETIERFFKYAKKLNVKIMFSPGTGELTQPKEVLRLLKYVDILILNRPEAAKLVPGVNLTELVYRLNNYVDIAIVTAGAMGGIAVNGQESYRFGIYEDVKIKDSTGAGCAFGAGFLAHLASGKSFRESLIFASANATAVVTKIGANKGALDGSEKLHPMPIQKI